METDSKSSDGSHGASEDDIEFWNFSLLISSFDSVYDAWYWFGKSSPPERIARMRSVHRGGVPPSAEEHGQLCPMLADVAAATTPGPPTLHSHPPSAPSVSVETTMPEIVVPKGSRDVMVFDTETVGLNPPIVCQLAYIIVQDGRVAEEYDQILRLPNGVFVSKGSQKIHGISTYDCRTKGVDAYVALETFARQAARILRNGGRVVAHNSAFDVRAIRMTREAWNIVHRDDENPDLEKEHVFCTMVHSKPYSPLVDKAGRKKAFRNEELYSHLYGSPPDFARLHNALDDVRVTLLNYVAAVQKGWWAA